MSEKQKKPTTAAGETPKKRTPKVTTKEVTKQDLREQLAQVQKTAKVLKDKEGTSRYAFYNMIIRNMSQIMYRLEKRM